MAERPLAGANVIEEFFKAHQHTIAAIAAAGTFAAVVVSLLLAWGAKRADRTRLRAVANLMIVARTGIDPKAAPELLVWVSRTRASGRYVSRPCSSTGRRRLSERVW